MPTDRPPIGTRIKRARERQKPRMTQQQLADLIGVSQKTVDNWENDRSYPRSAIGALEEVLGKLVDEEPSPAIDTDTEYPDWVPKDAFLEHIYRFGLPDRAGDDDLNREKLIAIRA